jgi:uncharacterized UBP type Zn finger protein
MGKMNGDVTKLVFRQVLEFMNDNPENKQMKPRCPICGKEKLTIEKTEFSEIIKGNNEEHPEWDIYNKPMPVAHTIDVSFRCEGCKEVISAIYNLGLVSFKDMDIAVYFEDDSWEVTPEDRWSMEEGGGCNMSFFHDKEIDDDEIFDDNYDNERV